MGATRYLRHVDMEVGLNEAFLLCVVEFTAR